MNKIYIPKVIQASAASLPYPDNYFEASYLFHIDSC